MIMETETITRKIIWEVKIVANDVGIDEVLGIKLFESESDADNFISNPPENMKRDRMYKNKRYLN